MVKVATILVKILSKIPVVILTTILAKIPVVNLAKILTKISVVKLATILVKIPVVSRTQCSGHGMLCTGDREVSTTV